MSSARAFTMIELMAVVVLVGLLAGATVVTLSREANRAGQADLIDRLIHADASARLAGQRMGPATLRFDLDAQRLWLITPGESADEPRAGHSLAFASGYRIETILTIDTTSRRASTPGPRRRIVSDSGQVDLLFSSQGLSQTYAIHLTGPGLNEPQAAGSTLSTSSMWLLFAGMTGQVVIEDDFQAIDNLLAAISLTRPDTD